jgi:predicted DCC family thiol-disulfide oxidoreductase YuxK
MEGKNIILFDGHCNLCDGLVRFIKKRDKNNRFEYVALNLEEGRRIMRDHGIADDNMKSMIYLREGSTLTKSSAALHVLKDLGGFWRLFFVFHHLPTILRDIIYNLIARFRYTIFGRRDVCELPVRKME